MTFIIERRTGRGVKRTEIAGSVLRIGRGTNAHLRSDSPSMAREHAQIEASDDGYVISDSGSVTGTYVDAKPIDRALLRNGSVIELGDLRIEVKADNPLLLSVSQRTASMSQSRIDFAAAYRLHRRGFAIAIAVVAAAVFIAAEVEPSNRRAFAPGSLSSAHAMVAGRCASCHVPWHGTSDRKCSACHAVSRHSKVAEPACAECHQEHRGAVSLTTMRDDRCTGCHTHHHPEFRFTAANNHLNFSHDFHLSLDLKCASCHNGPVRFATACQSCHRLDVPHGIPLDVARKLSRTAAEQCASCHVIAEASIVTPVIQPQQLAHARFDHALHRAIACRSCHATGASDMLMPPRATCQQCHAASGCVSCHDYHHRARSLQASDVNQRDPEPQSGMGGGQ